MRNILGIVLVSLMLLAAAPPEQQPAAPLKEVQRIPLPVDGRIDHFNIDRKSKRMFIAALGNNTVEVVDLEAGKWVRSLPGFEKPQGVWYSEKLNKLFIASGNDGTCKVYDGKKLALTDSIKLDLGADTEAFDARSRQLLVGYGGEDANKDFGDIAIIDVRNDKHVADIKTDAHPGGILPNATGDRIYITVPKTNRVGIINRRTRQPIAMWQITEAERPVALALDEDRHRLFVATRKPGKVVVYDTETHGRVASMDSIGLIDGMFFDRQRARLYVSGGDGFIAVYQQRDADHYDELAKIPTGPIARTSLFVPELNRFYVAIPKSGNSGAELRVYEPQP